MNRQISSRNAAMTLVDGDYGIKGFIDHSGGQARAVGPRIDATRTGSAGSSAGRQTHRDTVVGAQIRVLVTLGCLAFWVGVIALFAF